MAYCPSLISGVLPGGQASLASPPGRVTHPKAPATGLHGSWHVRCMQHGHTCAVRHMHANMSAPEARACVHVCPCTCDMHARTHAACAHKQRCVVRSQMHHLLWAQGCGVEQEAKPENYTNPDLDGRCFVRSMPFWEAPSGSGATVKLRHGDLVSRG